MLKGGNLRSPCEQYSMFISILNFTDDQEKKKNLLLNFQPIYQITHHALLVSACTCSKTQKNRTQSLILAKISAQSQFAHTLLPCRETMTGNKNNLEPWQHTACWLQIKDSAVFTEIRELFFHVRLETRFRAGSGDSLLLFWYLTKSEVYLTTAQ